MYLIEWSVLFDFVFLFVNIYYGNVQAYTKVERTV